MKITQTSVTVMRSHDYCHFSVTLSADIEHLVEVDQLRKIAARHADKAVEQYKIKKTAISLGENLIYGADDILAIEKIPESERTPEQQAQVKSFRDRQHYSNYDYEDEWQERGDF